MKFLKLNNKGIGIIETLISAIILVGVYLAIVTFLSSIERQVADISSTSKARKGSAYLLQTILSQSSAYQFYPEGTVGFAGVTDRLAIQANQRQDVYDALAFFINKDGDIKPVTPGCVLCFRRVGTSLTPLGGSLRGIFKLWIVGVEKKRGNTYEIFLDLKMVVPLI